MILMILFHIIFLWFYQDIFTKSLIEIFNIQQAPNYH